MTAVNPFGIVNAIRKTTIDGKLYVSAIDTISQFSKACTESSRKFFTRNKKNVEAESSVVYHQFPGQGQRETPCVDANGALFLMMRVPGKAAMQFRLKCFDILKRYFAGDASLGAEAAANAGAPTSKALAAPGPARANLRKRLSGAWRSSASEHGHCTTSTARRTRRPWSRPQA